jgi:hypothetical protein
MFKLKNIGKTKTVLYKDGKIKNNVIDWSLNSDDKNGMDLNISMDDDGNKLRYHHHLSNEELEELLTKPVINKSLDQRLIEDFKPYDNIISRENHVSQFPTEPQIIIIPNKISKKNRPLRKTTRKIRPRVIKIKMRSKKHHHNSSESRSSKSRTSRSNKRNKKIYIFK